MRLRNDPLSRFNRVAFTFLMVIALTGGPVLMTPVARGEPTPDPAAQLRTLADGIEQYAKAMKPVLSAVDHTRFQSAAVVAQVGKDPVKLLDWVRTNTRPIPYRGCLRGPGGVLMDCMGNSLDRSILLARMFQEAGLTARLAHGTLDAAAAQAILSSAATTQPAAAASHANDDQLLQQIASASGLSVDQIKDNIQKQDLQSQKDREQLVGTVTEQSKRLMKLLSSVAKEAPAPKPDIADTSDHWWVQYSAGGQWIDADPASPQDGKALCAATETVDLPKDWSAPLKSRNLLHELTVRVRIEQSAAEGRHEFTAMERTFPACQFVGKAITLNILPLHWPGDLDLTAPNAPQKLKDTLKAQTEWVPLLLIDGQQWYQDGFDDHGKIDKHPSLDSFGQLGGGIAKGVGGVLGAFGDLGADNAQKDTNVLTAAWIEYEIHTPGESSPKIIRRDLYDFFGSGKRASGLPSGIPTLDDPATIKRSAELYQTADILPTGCILSQDYVTAISISELERMAPILSGALRQAASGAVSPALKQFSQANPLAVSLMGLAALRTGPAGVGADHLAIDHLNVFSQRQGLTLRDDGTFGGWKAIDIVANPVTIQSPGAESASSGFTQSVRQGVFDTYMERAAVSGTIIENVSAMYQASAASGKEPWVLLKKGDDPSKLKLSPDAQARIASDLSAGYLVIAPQSPVTLNKHACEGWWRIDPATGSTLGIGASGMGAEMAEYATLLKIMAVQSGLLAFAGCGGIAAAQQGNTFKAVGCAICGVLAGVLIYFSGLGVLGGTSAGARAASGFAGWYGGTNLSNACNTLSAVG